MLLAEVRHWLGVGQARMAARSRPPISSVPDADPGEDAPAAVDDAFAPQSAGAPWPAARIAMAEALWGEGFLLPGGPEEVMRLARPLGVSAAATLLMLGAGLGGPPVAIASKLGAWVSGFESDPALLVRARVRAARAGLGKRVAIEDWSPERPAFRAGYFHHALAIEPLRGAPPEPVLAAMAQAVKPTGQLVLTELVADASLDPIDRALLRWAALEGRGAALPSEFAITRGLGRLGFEVRVVEDVSARQASLAMSGWRAAIRALSDTRPSRADAAVLVREAEAWLLRLRLIRTGGMRLMRWHAICRRGA
jgi:SAM-dependent methyltransferase